MKFYFFNDYTEGRDDPTKHLQNFYFSVNSNQDIINVHLTKESYLVGFELVFVLCFTKEYRPFIRNISPRQL